MSLPSNHGAELAKVIKGLKFAQISIDDQDKVIRYCIILVGVRAKNIPVKEEIDVLFEFITKNFGNHTPEEIKMAFNMAVSGRLTVDSNCYENFSCEFFGRIMSAYRKWAQNEIKQIPEEKEVQKLIAPPADWSNFWQDCVQAASEGTIETKIVPAALYEWLVEKKYLQLDIPERKQLFLKARNGYQTELGIKAGFGQLKGQEIIEYDILKNNLELPDELHLRISNRAKVMACKQYALTQI